MNIKYEMVGDWPEPKDMPINRKYYCSSELVVTGSNSITVKIKYEGIVPVSKEN